LEQIQGSYLYLPEGELDRRAETAYEIYRECRVCPRGCGVDRTGGGRGFCGLGDGLKVSSFVRHYGEEPPLVGQTGVGNIFVTSCNLACSYCQNYQISQEDRGADRPFAVVAEEMLQLQAGGVNFLGWVSPSHIVPGLLKSLALARKKGFRLPIVYNTNAYDSVETLKLLDGVVDVYLPDLKYSDNRIARDLSRAADYVERSREAVLEMFRQVGPLRVRGDGLAERGLMVRHLVLPEGAAGTWETLCFIALELSPRVPVSLMSQYRPVHRALGIPGLARRITASEYQAALAMAGELGFETLFTQDPEDEVHNLPDFRNPNQPFPLDRVRNHESFVC